MKKRSYLFSAFLVLILTAGISLFAQPASAELLGCDNTGGNLFRINETTGTATYIGTMPQTMTECVFDNVNRVLYAQGSDGSFTFYTIDPTTGASLGALSTSAAFNGMEFVNGVLYATAITGGGNPSDLVTVDPATGVLTNIGATGFGPISGLAYDRSTGVMYGVTGGGSGPSNLITLNLTTGAGTLVASTGQDKIGSIRFGSNGVLYGGVTGNTALNPNYLITINKTTGAVSPVGDTGFSISGLALIVNIPGIPNYAVFPPFPAICGVPGASFPCLIILP